MRISDWSSDVCSSDLRCCRVFSGKHDGLLAVQLDPVFHVPTHRAGQDLGLYFAPEIDHLLRRERVIHANHVLLDARPLVQVRRNKMRRRTDQLHAALMRAMIRLSSEEHTSALQALMRILYTVFCFKK